MNQRTLKLSYRYRLNEGKNVICRGRMQSTPVGKAGEGHPIEEVGDLAVVSENDLWPLPPVEHPLLAVSKLHAVVVGVVWVKVPFDPISRPCMTTSSPTRPFFTVRMEESMPTSFVAIEVTVFDMTPRKFRKQVGGVPGERSTPTRGRRCSIVRLSASLGVVDGAPKHLHRAIVRKHKRRWVHVVPVPWIGCICLTSRHILA